jgi:hypothetical protein
MLTAIPLNEDKSHPDVYFARLPSINLKACVEFVERKKSFGDDERDVELDKVLQEQQNCNFKDGLGTKPFWRLVILFAPGDRINFTATWIFHHALAVRSSSTKHSSPPYKLLLPISQLPNPWLPF